jgi:hypothetical protein
MPRRARPRHPRKSLRGLHDDDAERFTFDDADDADDADEPRPEARSRRGTAVSGGAHGARRAAPRSTPARFAARMLVVVTLGYAVVSAYLYTHVDAAYQMMADVPLIGPRLVERHLSSGRRAARRAPRRVRPREGRPAGLRDRRHGGERRGHPGTRSAGGRLGDGLRRGPSTPSSSARSRVRSPTSRCARSGSSRASSRRAPGVSHRARRSPS